MPTVGSSRTPSDQPAARDGYSHPRCYAGIRADCSPGLSSEHFLSRALLRRIEPATGGIYVRGFPWQKKTVEQVGISSLAANVLCKRHNSQLSGLDGEALRLVDLIERWHSREPGVFAGTVCGEKIERYLLKVLCGALAARSACAQGARIISGIPDRWTDLLFGDSPFPAGWGLYLNAHVGDRWDNDPRTYSVAPVLLNAEPAGLCAVLRGFRLVLLMADPGPNPEGAVDSGRIRHPKCIEANHPHGQVSIRFLW